MTLIVLLGAAYLAGCLSMFPGGVAYARAVRAYRDWRATVAALRGLRRHTAQQWLVAARRIGAVVAILAMLAVAAWWSR